MRTPPVTPGKTPPPSRKVPGRQATRLPVGLRASWRPLAAAGERLAPAQVCNLSETGVAFLAEAPSRPGAIVVVRLEAPSGRLTAPRLAHVKHATRQDDGRWLLGCAFATPLGEDELDEFCDAAAALEGQAGGEEAPAAGGAAWLAGKSWERRASPRRNVPLTRVVLWDAGSEARTQGWVADLSQGGLGVLGLRPFAAGAVLRVRAASAASAIPWIELEVRSCRKQGQRWLVGCQFRSPPHPLA